MKILGLCGGIASIGWGLIVQTTAEIRVIDAGVWSFDSPETPKERTPLNAVRRQQRGQRRVIRRRRQRMNQLRMLFYEGGLLTTPERDALSLRIDPWVVRALAFARPLRPPELAVALGHIAAHRGFKSAAKHQANEVDETSRMKKAIALTQQRLQQYRTVGLMFAMDPEFQDRKHNRGDFSRSVLREDLLSEVRQIFVEQRRLGNKAATVALEKAYIAVAFFQRPVQDSEHLVGACRFEPAERRTATRSYAFEMFRLLSRLANITLSNDGVYSRLDGAMIRTIAENFGDAKGISYRAIRTALDLGETVSFVGVNPKDEKNDVVARMGHAAEGTYTLRRVVGEKGWAWLMRRPVIRDRIAELLTYRADPESIREGLGQAGLTTDWLEAVMEGVNAGAFSRYTGTGHISALAARRLLPGLRQGLGYAAACDAAGYDHDAPAEVSLDDVRNPVARKAATELLKQVSAVIKAYGMPDAIHVALLRDVGKSAEERDEISRGIEAASKRRDNRRSALTELLAREVKGRELARYELWFEQGGHCLYTGTPINPMLLASRDNELTIGHILPWSRFGDDSFMNKTLCLTNAAQSKQDRTPWEWSEAGGLNWEAYSARVAACVEMKTAKKRGFYTRKNAAEVEADFRNRHLSDSRYIARLISFQLRQTWPTIAHIRTRPTQLIAKLRRAWGLDALKHEPDGTRKSDDRHRAVDAMIVATITERMLEDLAKAAREAERNGSRGGFDLRHIDSPAEGFSDVVSDLAAEIFPARAERRRVRGEVHAATIKRIKPTPEGDVVQERKPVEKLTLADLDRVPYPAPYGRVREPVAMRNAMVISLRDWIERGRPKDDLPRSPKGDVIRKVRLVANEEPRVLVRGGTADRGDVARVDVFTALSKTGKRRFQLVPIYPHQIIDRVGYSVPPDRAVGIGVAESDWPLMAPGDFLFSLFSHSLIEITKPDGEIIRGYFKGVDRATGAIGIADPCDMRGLQRAGAKTLLSFEKLRVDRMGQVTTVGREARTWRGEVVGS